jgi:hypothetical protein
MEGGGDTFKLVPNLNDDKKWFDSVFQISREKLQQL